MPAAMCRWSLNSSGMEILSMTDKQRGVKRIIRMANDGDIPAVMEVLAAARETMTRSGNPSQWPEGYPSLAMIGNDLANETGQVIEDDGKIVGYFSFVPSPDPTYAVIYDGAWLDDSMPYHVIHRIASLPQSHGIFSTIINWCIAKERNIRVDTHRDNTIMRHCILKAGFSYCGIIHLANGDERLAYQKINRDYL